MASSTRKVLGQNNPSATTNTDMYTVPASTDAVVSSLTVCNRDSTNSTFRIAIRPAGASLSNEHYLYYDITLPGNDTFVATIGLTLAETDVVTIYSSSANLSFQLFGQENT